MDRLFGDLSSGVRMLVRYPTLSLGAILTLGAGIGLSTTVFCVVNSGMFKGLPFPNADRIVAVFSSNAAQGQPRLPLSVHDLAIHQARQTSFEAIGPYGSGPYNLSLEAGRPERFQGGQLSLEAFKALGVQPLLGRGFQAGDDLPGAGNVCCSATICGGIATAAPPISSAGRFARTGRRSPSSASCRQSSRSRSANLSGYRLRHVPDPGRERS